MAEPPDQTPAAAGRGDLRASYADRERVIGVLKAAFVQGMLVKDEFYLRVGLALVSRTYAELAALTADLPAGLAAAQPPEPPWAPGEPGIPRPGRVFTVATRLYAGVWLYAILFPTGGENDTNGALIFFGGFLYLLLLLTIGTQVFANWLDKRSARQLPPGAGPGPRGRASPRLPSDPAGSFPRPIPIPVTGTLPKLHEAIVPARRCRARGHCADGAPGMACRNGLPSRTLPDCARPGSGTHLPAPQARHEQETAFRSRLGPWLVLPRASLDGRM